MIGQTNIQTDRQTMITTLYIYRYFPTPQIRMCTSCIYFVYVTSLQCMLELHNRAQDTALNASQCNYRLEKTGFNLVSQGRDIGD